MRGQGRPQRTTNNQICGYRRVRLYFGFFIHTFIFQGISFPKTTILYLVNSLQDDNQYLILLFLNVAFHGCIIIFCFSVGMCNPRNYSDTPPTSKSTVEELHESIPSLFQALTEGDTQLNWNIVSFPVAEELSHHENLVSILETVNHPPNHNISVPNNNIHTSYSSDKGKLFKDS